MSVETSNLVDAPALARARAELGTDFARILGYFREDGVKSLSALEEAVRKGNAVAMVIPAHTLKGEARQFGATALATLAEKIEDHARLCIEHHDSPEGAIEDVVALRPVLLQTLALLERDGAPVVAVPVSVPAPAPTAPVFAPAPLVRPRGPGGFGRKQG
ncbi:HPt (histidine-containing phosphotransfer) domain-containing protein [Sphingomonas sp. BE138]|uniref:Hpt domain-containing protein n=1 Tax=Sphingomonas sp. BE138 TaxID=2817845 RepID=UPI00285DECA0|nr:Hpt domain-containing protein [Sphingomonas sp. BE138]MDR6788603.1 HPt (histidine-containing phosphotransfer) domain-containing protein [Sphingomonas sp. BE138]